MVALDQSSRLAQKHEVDAYEARVEDAGDTGHSDSIHSDTPLSPSKVRQLQLPFDAWFLLPVPMCIS